MVYLCCTMDSVDNGGAITTGTTGSYRKLKKTGLKSKGTTLWNTMLNISFPHDKTKIWGSGINCPNSCTIILM